MAQLTYRLWPEHGRWHWEVLAGPLRLGHGATLKPVQARAEAMSYAFHADRIFDIDNLERQTTAARRQMAAYVNAKSKDRAHRAYLDVSRYTTTYSVTEILLKQATEAVRESRALLAEIETLA